MVKGIHYLYEKDVNNLEKFHYLVLFLVRLYLAVAILGALYNFQWTVLFVSLSTFILSFAPELFSKRTNIKLPVEFQIAIVLFIYATLFLGEIKDYYFQFWWWDILLHTGSAFVFGLIGFIIIYILYKGNRMSGYYWVLFLFSFCFAIAIGALWEIFEFAMDQLFGFNMQKTGLIDTMWDLIVDSIGAFVASLIGYFYIKYNWHFYFGKIIKKFESENPRFFIKKEFKKIKKKIKKSFK